MNGYIVKIYLRSTWICIIIAIYNLIAIWTINRTFILQMKNERTYEYVWFDFNEYACQYRGWNLSRQIRWIRMKKQTRSWLYYVCNHRFAVQTSRNSSAKVRRVIVPFSMPLSTYATKMRWWKFSISPIEPKITKSSNFFFHFRDTRAEYIEKYLI